MKQKFYFQALSVVLLLLVSLSPLEARPVPNLAVPIVISLTPLGAAAAAALPGILLGKALVASGVAIGFSLGGMILCGRDSWLISPTFSVADLLANNSRN